MGNAETGHTVTNNIGTDNKETGRDLSLPKIKSLSELMGACGL